MFTHILLASDGSAHARRAAIHAVALAKTFGSRLTFMHVHTPFSLLAHLGELSSTSKRQFMEKQWSDAFCDVIHLADSAGVAYQTVIEGGHPVEKIVQAAEKLEVDLVVIGGRGAGGIKSLMLGSVADGALHHAHCPVLIVRGKRDAAGDGLFHNILLASDGSKCALHAAEAAGAIAEKLAAPVTIVNVFEPPVYADAYGMMVYYGLDDEFVDKAQEEAICSAGRIVDDHNAPFRRRKERGFSETEIMRVADEDKCDLIVLGSRGLSGVRALLIGSISDRVAHQADCPVLIVK